MDSAKYHCFNVFLALLFPVTLLVGLSTSLSAQEWTRFRGPNGSGVSSTARLPVRWSEKEYKWKIELPGVGHSSPVIWGDRVFITSGEEKTGTRIALCHRASNGDQLWRREFPGKPHGKHEDSSFASATPTIDSRHIYLTWAGPIDYLVMALDHDGSEVWRVDLGPYKSGHGFGTSPILFKDAVIIADDMDGASTLIALETASGKIRWRLNRQSQASYSTPCIFRPESAAPQLIFTTWDHGITSLDPANGAKNWELDAFSKGHVETAIASPIAVDDRVIATCGWLGVKNEVVAVRPGAERGNATKVLYRIERSAPLVPTPLVINNLLFIWGDGGMVSCADALTGELYWRQRVPGTYYGSPVCAGNCLYCISREGQAVVVAADKTFKLLARNEVNEGSHSTPAVAGGRMYIRTFSHLLSVGR